MSFWFWVWLVSCVMVGVSCYLTGRDDGRQEGWRLAHGNHRCDRPRCRRWAVSMVNDVETRPNGVEVSQLIYARCERHDEKATEQSFPRVLKP